MNFLSDDGEEKPCSIDDINIASALESLPMTKQKSEVSCFTTNYGDNSLSPL